jgi:biopolymer transport protein ExbB/TolQ
MPSVYDTEVIEAVKRALRRSMSIVHAEMIRGLNGLATVSSVAPLVGLFGTLLSIVNSFVGCGAAKSTCMAAVFERLSESLLPTVLGFLVALPALLGYKYLSSKAEAFDLEMENASDRLLNYLSIYLGLGLTTNH